jgi:hypothetical protein
MTPASVVTPGLLPRLADWLYLAIVLELVTGFEPVASRLQVGCSADMSFTSSCVVPATVVKNSTLKD